jgi:hypothetical protein
MDDSDMDVYFVERNAVSDRERRARPTVISRTRTPGYHPPAIVPPETRVTYGGPATFAGPAPFAGPAQFGPPGLWAGNQPVYMQPPAWGWGMPGTLGGLFAGLNGINIGTLVDLVGQGFAAIRSLPNPPTASGDSGTDVANLVLYQQALAEHAQNDERIRTAVHIIGKLLGA